MDRRGYLLPVFIATLLFTAVSCSDGDLPTDSGETYTLTVLSSPSEGGQVDPESGEYEEGETVQVTATAEGYYRFTGWEGDVSSEENPLSVQMEDNTDITAMFEKRSYPLSIDVEGEGTVEEQIIQPRTTEYDAGTVVELTAVPSEGWTFAEWAGDVEREESPTEITIEEETAVTAVFEREQYTLELEVDGEGQIAADPDGQTYASETTVELTAEADSGWVFTGWAGDLGGEENPAELTMDADKQVSAEFSKAYRVQTSADGGGVVSADPDRDWYVTGKEVELSAEADSAWVFSGWTGDLGGDDNPATITVDDDQQITGVFTRTYRIDLDAETGGQITATPDRQEFEEGENVELSATAEQGYHFTGWEGDLGGEENPVDITIDSDKQITATFSPNYADGVTLQAHNLFTEEPVNGHITFPGHRTVELVNGQATITADDQIHADSLAQGKYRILLEPEDGYVNHSRILRPNNQGDIPGIDVLPNEYTSADGSEEWTYEDHKGHLWATGTVGNPEPHRIAFRWEEGAKIHAYFYDESIAVSCSEFGYDFNAYCAKQTDDENLLASEQYLKDTKQVFEELDNKVPNVTVDIIVESEEEVPHIMRNIDKNPAEYAVYVAGDPTASFAITASLQEDEGWLYSATMFQQTDPPVTNINLQTSRIDGLEMIPGLNTNQKEGDTTRPGDWEYTPLVKPLIKSIWSRPAGTGYFELDHDRVYTHPTHKEPLPNKDGGYTAIVKDYIPARQEPGFD